MEISASNITLYAVISVIFQTLCIIKLKFVVCILKYNLEGI